MPELQPSTHDTAFVHHSQQRHAIPSMAIGQPVVQSRGMTDLHAYLWKSLLAPWRIIEALLEASTLTSIHRFFSIAVAPTSTSNHLLQQLLYAFHQTVKELELCVYPRTINDAPDQISDPY